MAYQTGALLVLAAAAVFSVAMLLVPLYAAVLQVFAII